MKETNLLHIALPRTIPFLHPIDNKVGGFNPSEKYARQIGSLPQVGLKIKDVGNHHLENMIVRIKHIPIMIGTLPKNGSPVLEINNISNIREIPQNYHTFAPRSLIPSKIARIHELKSTWHSPDVLV